MCSYNILKPIRRRITPPINSGLRRFTIDLPHITPRMLPNIDITNEHAPMTISGKVSCSIFYIQDMRKICLQPGRQYWLQQQRVVGLSVLKGQNEPLLRFRTSLLSFSHQEKPKGQMQSNGRQTQGNG